MVKFSAGASREGHKGGHGSIPEGVGQLHRLRMSRGVAAARCRAVEEVRVLGRIGYNNLGCNTMRLYELPKSVGGPVRRTTSLLHSLVCVIVIRIVFN